MMRIIRHLIIALLTAASICGPAHACMSMPQTVNIFWDSPPAEFDPDEVGLRVRFIARGSEWFRGATGSEFEDEFGWSTCYSETYVFEVLETLHGDLDAGLVTVRVGDYAMDNPTSRSRPRTLIGKVFPNESVAPIPAWFQPVTLDDFVPMPAISPRLPPEQPKQLPPGDLPRLGPAISRLPALLWANLWGTSFHTEAQQRRGASSLVWALIAVITAGFAILIIWRRRRAKSPP